MDKKSVVYTHTMEYYLAINKNKLLPFATYGDLEGIMLNEINQTEENKYHVILLFYGI